MAITTDPDDPRLQDTDSHGLQKAYLVLSDAELEKGFVRPVRKTYVHQFMLDGSPVPPEPWVKKPEGLGGCGAATTMATAIAETYARDPEYYGLTYCVGCRTHLPVHEFTWDGTTEQVGS